VRCTGLELVSEDLILLDIDVKSKEEVLNNIAFLLEKDNRLNSKELFIRDVYLREEELSTSMGLNMAIPHAKSEGVKVTSLVFLRLKNEITWNEEDKVRFIFGIAVPKENDDNIHLKILSNLARKLINEEYVSYLSEVQDKKECVELLSVMN
jgi:fructose-specific phosphotransferase system IIA component